MTSVWPLFKTLSWTSKEHLAPSCLHNLVKRRSILVSRCSPPVCWCVCWPCFSPSAGLTTLRTKFRCCQACRSNPTFASGRGTSRHDRGSFSTIGKCVLLPPCTSQLFFFFLHGVNCSGSWFPLHTMDTISGTCELCSNERLRYRLQVCDVTERATHRSPGALVERRPRLQLARWLPVGERTVSRKG